MQLLNDWTDKALILPIIVGALLSVIIADIKREMGVNDSFRNRFGNSHFWWFVDVLMSYVFSAILGAVIVFCIFIVGSLMFIIFDLIIGFIDKI